MLNILSALELGTKIDINFYCVKKNIKKNKKLL
jgi:hypothetical protein